MQICLNVTAPSLPAFGKYASNHCRVTIPCVEYITLHVCPLQATTYKLDFELERMDRDELIGRFEGEREAFQADIAKLNDQLTAMHLEHDDTLAQLQGLKELSLPQKYEVRIQP